MAASLAYAVGVLFTGGLLKGVTALGMPTFCLPLLTLTMGLKGAVSTLIVPLLAANLAQSLNKQRCALVVRRFWPVLLTLTLCEALFVKLMITLPERLTCAAAGLALLIVPPAAQLWSDFRVSASLERWLGPAVGALAGALGGISAMPGPPLFVYLACLRLPKEDYVVAVSFMVFVGSLGLVAGLFSFGATTPLDLLFSGAASLPVFIGMSIGRKVRLQMSERAFGLATLLMYVFTGTIFLIKAF